MKTSFAEMIARRTDLNKIARLIEKLEAFVCRLEGNRDLNIHQMVNQFYYMQKAAEFKVLCDRLEETEKKLEILTELIESEYSIAFKNWQRDLRWLNSSTSKCQRPIN